VGCYTITRQCGSSLLPPYLLQPGPELTDIQSGPGAWGVCGKQGDTRAAAIASIIRRR